MSIHMISVVGCPSKLLWAGLSRCLRSCSDAESGSHLLSQKIRGANPGFGIGWQSGHLKRHFAGQAQRCHGPFQFVAQGLPGKLPGYPDLFVATVPGRGELAHHAIDSADGKIYVDGDHPDMLQDRKSTRLNSSHLVISYAVFCLKKK